MNKKMIFNHYANIIDDLIEEYDFFKYYFQYPFALDEDISYRDEDDHKSPISLNHLDVKFGATRGCFIDNQNDWVVKFNNPEEANCGSCENEMDIYNKACVKGLEKYFAQPVYLGDYVKKITFYEAYEIEYNMGRYYFYDEMGFYKTLEKVVNKYEMKKKELVIRFPLYAYPRAKRYEFFKKEEEQNISLVDFVSKSNSPLIERGNDIGYAFAERYGEEEFLELSEFLEEENINDLHSGNIMERNGNLILTDYAGYND